MFIKDRANVDFNSLGNLVKSGSLVHKDSLRP